MFEKGRQQIVIFLLVYIAISVLAGMSAFQYLAPKFISVNTEIGIYALFSIMAAIFVYIYTKKRFVQAGQYETTYSMLSEQERKEKELKEQQEREIEAKKRKQEAEKQQIKEKIDSFSENVKGETDAVKYFDQLLIEMSKSINIVQGIAYTFNKETQSYDMKSTYAYYSTETDRSFALGEGIPGQVAKDQKVLQLDKVPDGYIKVVSGLGSSSPKYLTVLPIIHDGKTIAILELASFEKPSNNITLFNDLLNEKIADKISSFVNA